MSHLKVISLLLSALLVSQSAHAALLGRPATSQNYAYGGAYDGLGSPTTFVVDDTCASCYGPWFDLLHRR